MFKVAARTILELGSELISSDIIALYELIRNGFDAGADEVQIVFDVVIEKQEFHLLKKKIACNKDKFDPIRNRAMEKLNTDAKVYTLAQEKLTGVGSLTELSSALDEIYSKNTITVSDMGSGMSLKELETVFLMIGTASRKRKIVSALVRKDAKSPFLGEKGVGRLSAMHLGHSLFVKTAREQDKAYNCLRIDWTQFEDIEALLEEIKIKPFLGDTKKELKWSGTNIVIGNLVSNWIKEDVVRLANDDISLLSNPLQKRSLGKQITISWNCKPITFHTLDSRLLSHAHASARGEYKIVNSKPTLNYRIEVNDLGFKNPKEFEIVELSSADLYGSLFGLQGKRKNKEKRFLDESALETVGAFSFEVYWFNRSQLSDIDGVGNKFAVKKLLDRWVGIRMYRDNFRVYPYGTEEDDWLGLDKRALRSSGYILHRLQLVGNILIDRLKNPNLIDQTNREGLCETPEQSVLREIIEFILNRLRQELKRVTKLYKKQAGPISTDEIQLLMSRMCITVRDLHAVVSKDNQKIVERLEQFRLKCARIIENAQAKIMEVETNAQQMLDLAGVGLMVEVVIHELSRVTEDVLDNLNSLRDKNVPKEVRIRLESLRVSLVSISKRLRILDPLSVSGRQRAERFVLNELIREVLDAHEVQFVRHGVSVKLELPDSPIYIKAVKGMVVQVLENLLSNSMYWLRMEHKRKVVFEPQLTICLDKNPTLILFEDNGPGIAHVYAEKIFDLFFSMKEKNQRRGLGLFIARECAEYNGGSLVLDLENENKEGRFTRFLYQVES